MDNMDRSFGFTIKRKEEPESIKSFTPEVKDDGAVLVNAGSTFGQYIDLDGAVRTEAELISKYREMALQPEISRAVNEIVNEAIVSEEGKDTVQLNLDKLDMPDNLKKVIHAEFDNILKLLDFDDVSYQMFQRWYIDGRCYYHVVIDENAPEEGIKELRYIDPRKIRKMREVSRKKDKRTQAQIEKTKGEYFFYSDMALDYGPRVVPDNSTSGIKIHADSIIYVPSGLMDKNNTIVLSYLNAAIKPLNQLRALEDATLIYHMSRAPERRIFNIEVGNLQKDKAEQFLRQMMVNYKNKLVYDAQTGEIKDDRKFMTMLEDFWLPKRDGKGTTIDVLSGGTQLSQLLESVEYFQDRLYRSMQVPMSRMKPDTVYNLGRATEITRDEVNFAKFIERIRKKFSFIFLKALEKQLILKKIASPDDWDNIKHLIRFVYLRDGYYSELKNLEIFGEKLNRLKDASEFAGTYYSHYWLRRNILNQSDEDIEEIDEQIEAEQDMPQYNQDIMMQLMQQEKELEDAKFATAQATRRNNSK